MILERKTPTLPPNRPPTYNTPQTRITFTYTTPFQHTLASSSPLSQHGLHTWTQPHKSKSVSSFPNFRRLLAQQNHNNKHSKKPYSRKKIFDTSSNCLREGSISHEQSVSLTNKNQRNKTKSALEYSEVKRKKKRNTIFQDYCPNRNVSLENQTLNQLNKHEFPLKKAAEPKSLIHYVDLQIYRKKKKQPIQNRISQTYISEGTELDKKDIHLTGFKASQQASEVYIPINSNNSATELEFDQYVKEYSHKEIEHFSDPLGHLLESVPRFYDQQNGDQIPPISQNHSYVDANLLKSRHSSELLKQGKGDENKTFPFFLYELSNLYGKTVGYPNILPICLLFLGFLLFLIQLTK